MGRLDGYWLTRREGWRRMKDVHGREAILTPREEEIVRLIVEGLGNRAIARRLFVSEKTVKAHIHRIFRSLGVSNRTLLAVMYVRETEVLQEWVSPHKGVEVNGQGRA